EGPAPAADRSELRLLTPEHAAPEQILDGPITTAADTWALGILLYELLAGARPFSAQDKSRLELETAICEEEPPPPSTAVRRRSGRGRGLRRGWSRQLAGDLDTIVRHALAK
ncbi:MAG: protein kinase, partial [Acidobacteria bacterium]|nr:protein kinase [Acidobacteriota bacterium]